MTIPKDFLNDVRENMGDVVYELCFLHSKPILDRKERKLLIISDDPNTYELIKHSFLDDLREILQSHFGQDWDIELHLKQGLVSTITTNGYHRVDISGPLNPRYTFDNFVTGSGNQFAYAAALAVAQSVASGSDKTYNPLFIYGRSGLGKTHLLQAIGNYVLKRKPEAQVMYVTIEQLTNDIINATKEKDWDRFHEKYRRNDVLLIDDVQFLEGREGTQEKLFHIFNDLYERGKQIALASDRPPKSIKLLEERLRTRFESGLIVDVQPPDFETRKAILKKKLENKPNIIVQEEALDYIAQRFRTNVRELEGALIRVLAYADLHSLEERTVVTLSLAKEALASLAPEESTELTPKIIKERVAEYFGITVNELMSARREKKVLYPRQIAMYLMRDLLGMSFKAIGEEFGGRDHTTVMHAYQKILKGLSTQRIHNDLKMIKRMLSEDRE